MTNIKIKFLSFMLCCLCFVACAGAETGLTFDVPAPPHSKLLDTKELRMANRQINTVLYGSDEDISTVSDYYRDFFQEQEFQKILDTLNAKTKKQLLRFKQDELVVSIAVFIRGGQTNVVIAKYLQAQGEPPPEEIKPSVKDSLFALPKKDVPGIDLSGIPRPPEGIRIMSRDEGGGATVMYTTPIDVATTADFYRREMAAQRWEPADEMAVWKAVDGYEKATGKKNLGIKSPFSDGEDFEQVVRDSYVLNFNSGSSTAEVIIFPNFAGRDLGSIVQITYIEKSR